MTNRKAKVFTTFTLNCKSNTGKERKLGLMEQNTKEIMFRARKKALVFSNGLMAHIIMANLLIIILMEKVSFL
jgi:hypothetical protein